MKVSTDACILGAWFARKSRNDQYILDIGSGTGLLMLMTAQYSGAVVHGIEIDEPAYNQSLENLKASPWKERLEVLHGDVRTFSFAQKYDFIISNPPFFRDQLHSEADNERVAKHSTMLNFHDLIGAVDGCLALSGSFGILLPHSRGAEFEQLASPFLNVTERMFIRQTPAHENFRVIQLFSRALPEGITESTLTIRDSSGKYTAEFMALMENYYLAG